MTGLRVPTGMSAWEGAIWQPPLPIAVHAYGSVRPTLRPTSCPTKGRIATSMPGPSNKRREAR